MSEEVETGEVEQGEVVLENIAGGEVEPQERPPEPPVIPDDIGEDILAKRHEVLRAEIALASATSAKTSAKQAVDARQGELNGLIDEVDRMNQPMPLFAPPAEEDEESPQDIDEPDEEAEAIEDEEETDDDDDGS